MDRKQNESLTGKPGRRAEPSGDGRGGGAERQTQTRAGEQPRQEEQNLAREHPDLGHTGTRDTTRQ